MLVYPLFQDLRRKYIKLHFTRNSSCFKYMQLKKTIKQKKKPAKDIINIGKCIYLTYLTNCYSSRVCDILVLKAICIYYTACEYNTYILYCL